MRQAMTGQWLEGAGDEAGADLLPLRIDFPLLISLPTESFAAQDFTLNVELGAIYVPTDQPCPCGTRGTIKFRASRFEQPFEVEVEVVRVIPPEEAHAKQPAGLGMQFVDLTDDVLAKLNDLIDGSRNGSVVHTIRNSIANEGKTVDQELRSRPADQKAMLALQATGSEIEALVRETNPTVMLRLLDNPRLNSAHMRTMLRSPKLTTRVLSAIHSRGSFLKSVENRYLFCIHMQTNVIEALRHLRSLPTEHLRKIAVNRQIKIRIRTAADELLRNVRARGHRR